MISSIKSVEELGRAVKRYEKKIKIQQSNQFAKIENETSANTNNRIEEQIPKGTVVMSGNHGTVHSNSHFVVAGSNSTGSVSIGCSTTTNNLERRL